MFWFVWGSGLFEVWVCFLVCFVQCHGLSGVWVVGLCKVWVVSGFGIQSCGGFGGASFSHPTV